MGLRSARRWMSSPSSTSWQAEGPAAGPGPALAGSTCHLVLEVVGVVCVDAQDVGRPLGPVASVAADAANRKAAEMLARQIAPAPEVLDAVGVVDHSRGTFSCHQPQGDRAARKRRRRSGLSPSGARSRAAAGSAASPGSRAASCPGFHARARPAARRGARTFAGFSTACLVVIDRGLKSICVRRRRGFTSP
jgi:hypothetical protein